MDKPVGFSIGSDRCAVNGVVAIRYDTITLFSIYTLSDLGVLSNLIGSLSLANEHY